MRFAVFVAVLAIAALIWALVGTHVSDRAEPEQTAANNSAEAAAQNAAVEPNAPAAKKATILRGSGLSPGMSIVVTRIPAIPQRFFDCFGDETRAFFADEHWPRPRLATATAGADGTFRCTVPRDASLSVVAEHLQVSCFSDKPEIEVRFEIESNEEDVVDDISLTIELTVLNTDKQPIADATVLVYHGSTNNPPIAGHTTDRTGRVSLRVGPWNQLLLKADGYASAIVSELTEDGTVILAPARHIAGRVLDAQGNPLAGATITARHVDDRGTLRFGGRWPWWMRRSGPDGAFRFEGLRKGQYPVRVHKPGYTRASAEIWPNETAAKFVLQRTASVEGMIVFEDGSPAPKAAVRTSPNTTISADEHGAFRLPDLAPGERFVSGWTNTHSAKGVKIHLEEREQRTGVRVILRPRVASYVRYQVFDHDGTPLDKVKIIKLQRPAGEKGRYHVGGRPITNRAGPLHTWLEATSSAESDVEPIRVDLPRPVGVLFYLVDENGAAVTNLANAEVNGDCWIESVKGNRLLVRSHPDVPIKLNVRADGFATVQFPPFSAQSRQYELRLTKATSTITGRVLDHEGLAMRTHVRADGVGQAWTNTEDDGSFLLAGLAPGPVRFSAATLRRNFELKEGENKLGTLRLPAPIKVRGTVVSENGDPVWQAMVRLLDVATGRNVSRDPLVRTRGDGSFDLTTTPSDLHIRIDKEGFATAVVPLSEKPRAVLRPGGTVKVLIPDREKERSWTVAVRSPDGRMTWRPRSTSRLGRAEWTLRDVPAGTWEVFLLRRGSPGQEHVSAPCTVVAGKTVTVRLR